MAYGYPYGAQSMPQMQGGYYQPQRLSEIAAQPQQSTPQQAFIVRPVASLEEAKAVPTDFSGAVTVMTDFSHGMIYTKALNYQDGT